MISKKSAEIVNNLNIPMLIYDYQKEHSCISTEICPALCHGENWYIKFSTTCQDPYDGYRLKKVCIEREFNPILDELFAENEVRGWIEELIDFAEKVQNKEERIENIC